VIEVAGTTATYDREVKLPLYAGAGIPEAWLVDIGGERLEVHRAPTQQGYGEVRLLRWDDVASPQAFPDVTVTVSEVLGEHVAEE
jgi:Uma2 family endonuclease